MIGGDPDGVEAAAVELGRAGRDLDDVGQAVRARGRVLTAEWSGIAADAAGDAIDTTGRRVSLGAETVIAAGPVYLVYAAELRSAQREYAAGEAMVSAGRAQQLDAAAQALRASDRPSGAARRDAAVAAAERAGARAASAVAEGEAMMAAAVRRKETASEVAARAVRSLADQLREAVTPRGAGADAPAADGSFVGGFQRAVGDVVEVVQDVADGARNVTGAAGQAAWDAGPGTVSWALGMSPFEGDKKVAGWIDGSERWLQQAWGTDTESREYQGTYTAGSLAGMIFGGKKFKEAAEESGEALRARARRGDDATGRTSGTELQGRPQAEAADADALQNGLPSWSPGDPLPNASHAIIGAKFNAYSMDPENKANHGKWKAFERLGYDVRHPDARAAAAQDVERQLRHELLSAGASPGKDSAWGRRLEVSAKLMGPSGRTGTLITVWQYDHGEVVPRLLTNWLKV